MNTNWKKDLINEINEYKLNLKNFKNKWCNSNIEQLFISLKSRMKSVLEERDVLLKQALAHYVKKLENEENKKTIEFIKEKIDKINYELNYPGKDINKIKQYSKEYYNIQDAAEKDKERKNILNFANDEELKIVKEFLVDFLPLIINRSDFNLERLAHKNYKFSQYKSPCYDYTNLMQALAVVGGFDFNTIVLRGCAPLNDGFSHYCQNKYYDMVEEASKLPVIEGCIEKGLFNFKVVVGFTLTDDSEEKDNYVFNETFLNQLIECLNKSEFSSSADFSINVAKQLKIEIVPEFKEYKRLYEETLEEIQVSNQKYYNEEKLRQDREEAEETRRKIEEEQEKTRQAIEEQAEYDRIQREEAARRELLMQEEQMEKDRQMRERQMEADRIQRQQQVEEQRRDQERLARQQQDFLAGMERCRHCAKVTHCVFKGSKSCAFFTPK